MPQFHPTKLLSWLRLPTAHRGQRGVSNCRYHLSYNREPYLCRTAASHQIHLSDIPTIQPLAGRDIRNLVQAVNFLT